MPVHAQSRSTAALILNLGTRWRRVVKFMLRSPNALGINPVLIEKEAEWVPEPVWTFSGLEPWIFQPTGKSLIPTNVVTSACLSNGQHADIRVLNSHTDV
jgi:hypothetical protein